MRDGSLSRALRTLRVLRVSLRLSNFVPDEFVEQAVRPPTLSRNANGPNRAVCISLAERVSAWINSSMIQFRPVTLVKQRNFLTLRLNLSSLIPSNRIHFCELI